MTRRATTLARAPRAAGRASPAGQATGGPPPVTIKEIARVAEVSIASVSRALNDQAGVASVTRERIQRIAERLGYTPDGRARALVTGEVPYFALLVDDIANPFYAEVARGAEETLERHGLSLLLVSTARRPERLDRGLELLLSRRVAGLLVATSLDRLPAPPSWERLRGTVTLVGQPAPRGTGLDAVEVDDRHGGQLAGQHLLQAGWRRIAYVAGDAEDRAARQRLTGLERALVEAGHGALAARSFGGWTIEDGYRQVSRLLTATPRASRPDAVFAANDLIAIGAARAAAEQGLRLGRDLGLIGYDDIEPIRHLEVPLSSVAQPKRELGARAVELLLDRPDPRPARPRRARLRPTLVVRASSERQSSERSKR